MFNKFSGETVKRYMNIIFDSNELDKFMDTIRTKNYSDKYAKKIGFINNRSKNGATITRDEIVDKAKTKIKKIVEQ